MLMIWDLRMLFNHKKSCYGYKIRHDKTVWHIEDHTLSYIKVSVK